MKNTIDTYSPSTNLSSMYGDVINGPQANIQNVRFKRCTTDMLSNLIKGLKAEKAYMKQEIESLGKISLGNIGSLYQALRNIQVCNQQIAGIKAELNSRKCISNQLRTYDEQEVGEEDN